MELEPLNYSSTPNASTKSDVKNAEDRSGVRSSEGDVSIEIYPCCENFLGNDTEISIPGLSRLMNPKYEKSAKAVWMAVYITCCIIGVWLTVKQLQQYFAVPLLTKVIVERNSMVTFPAFTLCSAFPIFALQSFTESSISLACALKNRSDCNEIKKLSFQELNIDLNKIWNHLSLDNVTVEVMGGKKYQIFSSESASENLEFTFHGLDSILGNCVNIRHIGKIPYLSAATNLLISIPWKSEIQKSDFYFIIMHNEPDESLTSFEFINNEFQMILPKRWVQLFFHEEEFTLKNLSSKPCYDALEEKIAMSECALNVLRKKKYCRLPNLPEDFPECQRLNDLTDVLNEEEFILRLQDIVKECKPKTPCKEVKYSMAIDFLYNVDSLFDFNMTFIQIRFADDTMSIVSQEYAYTFPALVSDLFAYWGFFLCLSAFVFVEIFEFIFRKTLHLIKLLKTNKS